MNRVSVNLSLIACVYSRGDAQQWRADEEEEEEEEEQQCPRRAAQAAPWLFSVVSPFSALSCNSIGCCCATKQIVNNS